MIGTYAVKIGAYTENGWLSSESNDPSPLQEVSTSVVEKDKGSELDDVRFVLSMLLGPAEQQHLLNLARGDTKDYGGRASLKAELRKLRDLRLITGEGLRRIPEGRQFDLKEIVALTDLGERCIERFGE